MASAPGDIHIDEAILQTQERLAEEGGSMGDLLGHFRDRISPVLIGEAQWARVLDCAAELPITMAALPFGFELPLHEKAPVADFGASLAAGTRSAEPFLEQATADPGDALAGAIARLFGQMQAEPSALREVVGRKLMLEYDIGSGKPGKHLFPGMFLRPGERPILGACEQLDEVALVVDALVSCLGWSMDAAHRAHIERSYRMQPEDTRMDSFGVFPSRSRAIRLAIMGFQSSAQLREYLQNTGWPGDLATVETVIERFRERADIVRTGINIDVQEQGLGPTLGLTLIVKQRYTKDSRYWLDGLTDWDPFLEALGQESLVDRDKLAELAPWVSKPTTLFAKSGRFVLLRGIHHIKLVICGKALQKAKAYVFMVLSGALSP